MTFDQKPPFAQLVIDVAVALVLFIIACAFSGLLQNYFTPNQQWIYTFWFALGMVPCMLYMRYRSVANFDNWDVVAFSPMPLVLGIASEVIGHQFALLTLIPFVPICLWIRRLLPVRNQSKSLTPGTHSNSQIESDANAG